MDVASGRVARWCLRLSHFQYKVCTRPGREHLCADATSRLPTLEPDRSVVPEDIPCLSLADCSRGWDAPNFGELEKENPDTLARMLDAQNDDQRCQDLRHKTDQSQHSLCSETKEGLLVRVAPLDGAIQVYVPNNLRRDLLLLEHDVVRACHPGVNRMYASISRHYYWESMAQDVYDLVASCASYPRNRSAPRRRTKILKLLPATDPFASLSMDLLGPLTETKTGNIFLLIFFFHRFSKLVRAVPLAGITATDVSSAFFRDEIFVYWPPDTVLTDNGPQFASLFFQGACNHMGIRNMFTSTYHPQTNSQVERFNKTLVDMFMHYIKDHQDSWDELVSVFALAYNSRPHRTTGVAPMDLVTPRRLSNFSRKRMPDGMTPDPRQSVAEAKHPFLESLKALLPQIRDSIDKTQARLKRDYDRNVRPRRVSVTSRLLNDGKFGADPHRKDDLKFLRSFKLNLNTPKFGKIFRTCGVRKLQGHPPNPPVVHVQAPRSVRAPLRSAAVEDPRSRDADFSGRDQRKSAPPPQDVGRKGSRSRLSAPCSQNNGLKNASYNL